MRSDMIAELRVVYYRGRFRAATTWSKVGPTPAADNAPVAEADRVEEDKATKLRHEALLRPVPAP